MLVDARLYAPSNLPPPHLSPFVDAEEEGYVPDYLATLRKMQASNTCKPLRLLEKRVNKLAGLFWISLMVQHTICDVKGPARQTINLGSDSVCKRRQL